MTFRDRLTTLPNSEGEEKNAYIKFDIKNDNADCEISCSKKDLANRLANLVHMANRIMEENLDEDIQKRIVSQRATDMRDLYLKDEEWVS